jgi:hypothetical protein
MSSGFDMHEWPLLPDLRVESDGVVMIVQVKTDVDPQMDWYRRFWAEVDDE